MAAMNGAVDAAQTYYSVKAKIAGGAKDLEAALVIAELKLGKIEAKDAKEKLAKHKLSAEDSKLVEGLVFDKELASWLDDESAKELAHDDDERSKKTSIAEPAAARARAAVAAASPDGATDPFAPEREDWPTSEDTVEQPTEPAPVPLLKLTAPRDKLSSRSDV